MCFEYSKISFNLTTSLLSRSANRLVMSVSVGSTGAWVTDMPGNVTSHWQPLSSNAIYYRANAVAEDRVEFVVAPSATTLFSAPTSLAGSAELGGILVLSGGATLTMSGPIIISPSAQLTFSSPRSGNFSVLRSSTAEVAGTFGAILIAPACAGQAVLSQSVAYGRNVVWLNVVLTTQCSPGISGTQVFLIIFFVCVALSAVAVIYLVLGRRRGGGGYEVIGADDRTSVMIPRESRFKKNELPIVGTGDIGAASGGYSHAYESLVMYEGRPETRDFVDAK